MQPLHLNMNKTKTFLLTALLLLAAKSTQAQYTSFTLDNPITTIDNGLHGHVKEVSTEGWIIDGDAHWTSTDLFDRKGQLIETDEWSYGGGVHLLFYYIDGKLDRILFADDTTGHTGYFYTYDTIEGGPLMRIYKSSYSTDTIHYTCDVDLIIAERSSQGEKKYKYNDDKWHLEYHIVEETQDDSTTLYDYDNAGRLIKRTSLKKGILIRTETISYNAQGDMIEYQQTTPNDDDTLFIIHEYTYDSYGNWITHTSNQYFEQRTITYYDDCYSDTLKETYISDYLLQPKTFTETSFEELPQEVKNTILECHTANDVESIHFALLEKFNFLVYWISFMDGNGVGVDRKGTCIHMIDWKHGVPTCLTNKVPVYDIIRQAISADAPSPWKIQSIEIHPSGYLVKVSCGIDDILVYAFDKKGEILYSGVEI